MKLLEKQGEIGIILLVKMEKSWRASALAKTPLKGNPPCAEITFRAQAKQTVTAGARIMVSRGFNAQAKCQRGGQA
jgi:2-keto-3-deoxy-6-phosphogluconate aldolase